MNEVFLNHSWVFFLLTLMCLKHHKLWAQTLQTLSEPKKRRLSVPELSQLHLRLDIDHAGYFPPPIPSSISTGDLH